MASSCPRVTSTPLSPGSTNLDYQETFELHRGNQLLQMAVCVFPGLGLGQGGVEGPSRCLSVRVCLQVGGGEL